MPDISAIIETPELFGFSWQVALVHKGKRPSGPIPLIRVENTLRFEESFPGVLLATANGQSIKVNSQRINRNAWFDSQDHDQMSLKGRNANWLLGVETTEAKFGPGPEDEYYGTPEELKAAWMEYATK